MAYTRVNWSESVPMNAANLNKMDLGIKTLETETTAAMLKIESTTFTPQANGSLSGIFSHTRQIGSCVKIGNFVHLTIEVMGTRNGSTGDFHIHGLPYIPKKNAIGSIAILRGLKVGAETQIGCFIGANDDHIRFVKNNLTDDLVDYKYVNCGTEMNGTAHVLLTISYEI